MPIEPSGTEHTPVYTAESTVTPCVVIPAVKKKTTKIFDEDFINLEKKGLV